ncbi:MAG: GNAT family N-acetyltransferase, partial [Glaciimonas sp.]|nr:GNAT family N-acetyltransferase [Glaciimonas sp.]
PTLHDVHAGQALVAQAARLHPGHPIKIGAQAHLQRFYSRFGFKTVGDVYDEDEISHIHMVSAMG